MDEGGGVNEGVADDTFSVTFLTETAYGYAWLFAAHYKIGVVFRHFDELIYDDRESVINRKCPTMKLLM